MTSTLMSDEALKQAITDICFENGGVTKPMAEKLYNTFKQQQQAAVGEVLDRLENELNEQKTAAEENLKYHTETTKNERLIRDWQGTVMGIEFCRPAIQAERTRNEKGDTE